MMKIFKRKFFVFTVFCLLFASCSEDENSSLVSDKATLSFAPILNDLIRSQEYKQEAPDLPACSDDAPAYVEIVMLQGEEEIVGSADSPFAIDLVSGEIYTDYAPELELEPGTYSLDYFAVYNSDDDLIWIAPRGEALSNLVEYTLPLSIDLHSGVKKYVDVSVVCFDDRMVNEYGYSFFDLIPTTTIEFCFFANYCNEAGRHYPAAYSVDIWLGTDDTGTPLYSGKENMISTEGDDAYADPLCVALPNLSEYADDEDYIYYEVNLLSWPEVYGEVSIPAIEGTLSRNDIISNFDGDSNVDYEHLAFGCGDDGGGNGNGECDINNPLDDCDNDGVLNENDNCQGTPEGVEVDEDGCESITVPGRDIVVLNDANIFDNKAMENTSNVKLVQNLVNFSTTGSRNTGDTFMFNYQNALGGAALFTDLWEDMRSTITAEGFTITDTNTQDDLLNIPSEVKVVMLVMPLTAYSVEVINSLKSFAGEGGRIIFMGEHDQVYGAGIPVENDFLISMGAVLRNTGGFIDCVENENDPWVQIPSGSLREHPIMDGVDGLSIACSSIIEPGSGDFPLFYDTTNTHVLGGVAKIDVTPISELQASREIRTNAKIDYKDFDSSSFIN